MSPHTVNIESLARNVRATEGSMALLKCEMKGYIQEDEDIQWFKEEERIYDGTQQRFFITYEDGTPNSAQYGRNTTVPGRVSILQILPTTLSDSGIYTCKIKGTTALSNVTLEVRMKATTSLPIGKSIF